MNYFKNISKVRAPVSKCFGKNFLQLPARAGSRSINAAIHNPIQIKKFLLPAISPVFTMSPFPDLLLVTSTAMVGPKRLCLFFSIAYSGSERGFVSENLCLRVPAHTP
jgi:hypothetical protein